eukprot:727159-Alexandrium_andersonii.AAC.1
MGAELEREAPVVEAAIEGAEVELRDADVETQPRCRPPASEAQASRSDVRGHAEEHLPIEEALAGLPVGLLGAVGLEVDDALVLAAQRDGGPALDGEEPSKLDWSSELVRSEVEEFDVRQLAAAARRGDGRGPGRTAAEVHALLVDALVLAVALRQLHGLGGLPEAFTERVARCALGCELLLHLGDEVLGLLELCVEGLRLALRGVLLGAAVAEVQDVVVGLGRGEDAGALVAA